MPDKIYKVNTKDELAQLIKADFEKKLNKKVVIDFVYSSGTELKVKYHVVKEGEQK